MSTRLLMMGRTAVTVLAVGTLSALLSLPAAGAAQSKSAADIYRDKCAVCHAADGAGKTAKGKKLKVKDVRETLKKMTPEQMAAIVAKGKEPDMDAFGKEFTPEQITQLVAYYRGLATQQ